MAIVHNNNLSLQILSTYLVENHLDKLDSAFEEYDNLSVPFTYMLAYGLSERAIVSKNRDYAEEYAIKAQEKGPLAYTNLYAYKYCMATYPDWIHMGTLQKLTQGDVYDLIPVVNIFTSHLRRTKHRLRF